MRIVLTGGGTGGHLFPLIAVSKKIKEKNPLAEFLFVGPLGELERKVMRGNNIPAKKVAAGKIRRYFSLANVSDIFKIPLGIIQSLWYLLFFMPDAIFSKGGYASLPVVIAGWIYRIPIMTHESDSVPGVANSFLGKFATRIAISYPQAKDSFTPSRVLLTGNPLRQEINQGNPQSARNKFSLSFDKKVIFVWGGSQGSDIINTSVINILPELLKRYQIIHQTGKNNFEKVKTLAGEAGIKIGRDGYYPIPFLTEELPDVLSLADIIISRAGANSLSEIAANGKASIIIPIKKSANNHQTINAYSIAKINGCVVLEEENLGKSIFLHQINELMENEELRRKLALNIKAFYHPDAAEKNANGILEIIKK